MAVPFLRSSWDRFGRSVSDAFRPRAFLSVLGGGTVGLTASCSRSVLPAVVSVVLRVLSPVSGSLSRLPALVVRVRLGDCGADCGAEEEGCHRGRGGWFGLRFSGSSRLSCVPDSPCFLVRVVEQEEERVLRLGSVPRLLDGRPVSERCLVVLGFGLRACPSRGLLRVVLGFGSEARAPFVRCVLPSALSFRVVRVLGLRVRLDVLGRDFGRPRFFFLRLRPFVFRHLGPCLRLEFDVVSFALFVPPLRAVCLVASFLFPCGRPCLVLLSDHPLVRSFHRGLSLGFGFGLGVRFAHRPAERFGFGEADGFGFGCGRGHRWWWLVSGSRACRFGSVRPASGVGRMVSASAPWSLVLSALGSAWRWPCLSRGAGSILALFPFLSNRFLLTNRFLWSVFGFRGFLVRFFSSCAGAFRVSVRPPCGFLGSCARAPGSPVGFLSRPFSDPAFFGPFLAGTRVFGASGYPRPLFLRRRFFALGAGYWPVVLGGRFPGAPGRPRSWSSSRFRVRALRARGAPALGRACGRSRVSVCARAGARACGSVLARSLSRLRLRWHVRFRVLASGWFSRGRVVSVFRFIGSFANRRNSGFSVTRRGLKSRLARHGFRGG